MIERHMTFVAEELHMFSIKTFNFKKLLNFNNIKSWPLKNLLWPTG